mmetsp:Transcript_11048/g.23917  ORF Transcript_11048/g.23917 Transcript_11048/m.23917 type:complete len:347 (-) Transcript_11048:576-1616(-)
MNGNGKMAVFAAAAVGILSCRSVDAFTHHPCISHFRLQNQYPPLFPPSPTQQSSLSHLILCASSDDNEDVVLYSDEWENGIPPKAKNSSRWNSLSPKVKAKIVKEAQAKAIRNKKKNESANDKKRRLMFYMKDLQRKKKRDSRIERPRAFDDRTPLSELSPGQILDGKVISLTNFGAYIDVGTECDGLLHISQISNTDFIEHPRQVFTPGDEVTVRVGRLSVDQKKLQLTMLPVDEEEEEDPDDVSDEEAIPLKDIAVDDELWGEIRRVTAYGAYVELGAEVEGWLHFMDHPEFGSTPGSPPSDFMKVGDRVRVWASDVDMDRRRLKLTAKRPTGLPGPRRELIRR